MDNFLTLDEFWVNQNEAHVAIVAEFRAMNQTPEENCAYWTDQMSSWYEGLITDAKEAYYAGEPIMDDITFDAVENCLRLIKKDSKVLKQVGSKIRK